MKRTDILYFVAATLFAIAAVLSFVNGSVSRGVIGIIGTISFVLSGIHWRRKNK
jgi:hypothetical protein